MSYRRLIPGLWVVVVLVALAPVSNATSFDLDKSPNEPEPQLACLVRYEIGEGNYLVWSESNEADRGAPLPVYEGDDEGDDVASRHGCWGSGCFSDLRSYPLPPRLAKDSPYWQIPGLKALPLPFRRLPTPVVIHFSPEQEGRIVWLVLASSSPVLTLNAKESTRRIEVTDFAWEGRLSDWSGDCWFGYFAQPQTIEIGEVSFAEVLEASIEPEKKPDDAPILPLFDGDGFSPSIKSNCVSCGLSDLAYGPGYPQMPPDSPNWVIPGVLAIRLAFRPIESPVASHDGAEYAFAKPNGEMIVVKSTIIPWGD